MGQYILHPPPSAEQSSKKTTGAAPALSKEPERMSKLDQTTHSDKSIKLAKTCVISRYLWDGFKSVNVKCLFSHIFVHGLSICLVMNIPLRVSITGTTHCTTKHWYQFKPSLTDVNIFCIVIYLLPFPSASCSTYYGTRKDLFSKCCLFFFITNFKCVVSLEWFVTC